MVQSTNDLYNTTDANGRPDPTLFSYGYEDDQNLYAAIRQFSGEEGSSQTRLATEGTNRQFAAIGARLSAIRQGLRGAAFAANGVANIGGAASADDADTGWGWFLNGNLGYGDREGTPNENEYDFDAYGYTLGVDYAFPSGLVVGATAGYNDYDVDFDTAPSSALAANVNGGGIESDGYAVSGFLSYQVERQYFDAIVSVGANDYDLTRRASFVAVPPPSSLATSAINRTFVADTESDQVSAQLTSGFVFGAGASTFDLYAGFDYLTIEVDGYTEAETGGTPGGLALTYDDEDADSLQSILGASWQYAISMGAGVVSPYAGAQWRHEFQNDADVIYYQYAFALKADTSGNAIDPSTYTFASPTDDPDEDFVNVNVGVSAQFANNFLAFLQYESALLIEDTTASRVTLGLRGTF